MWGFEVAGSSLDRLVYLQLHRFGWMGADERRFLERTVRPGMRVVDIGANLGLYTLLLSRLVGESGSVVALEPDPELFACLQRNCRQNQIRNTELHNVAAGSAPGRVRLARSLINAGDNRLSQRDSTDLTMAVEVPVTTLDQVIRNRRVDFLKMDVQGWESHALAGMQELLHAAPAIQVCFEYWPYGLRRAGSDPRALLRQFAQLDFQIFEIVPGQPKAITDLENWSGPAGRKYTNLHAVRRPVPGFADGGLS